MTPDNKTPLTTPTGTWDFFTRHWSEQDWEGTTGTPHFTLELTTGEPPPASVRITQPTRHAPARAAHRTRRKSAVELHLTRSLTHPLIITHTSSFHDTFITVHPGVTCSIIEHFTSTALTSHAADIHVHKGAHLTYAQIQHANDLLTEQHFLVDGTLTHVLLSANKGRTNTSAEAQLREERAASRHLNLILGTKLIRTQLTITHAAPHTSSELLTRGALESEGIYEGRVHVPTPKSTTQQEARYLLLNPAARLKTSPQLFITHNDVRCGHAAAAHPLDPTQQFYLSSRGLPPPSQRALLIKAFLWPVLEQLTGPVAHHLQGMAEPLMSWFAHQQ